MDKLERFLRMAYEAGLCGAADWYGSYFEDMAEQAERDGNQDAARAMRNLKEKIAHDQRIVFSHTMHSGVGHGTCHDLRLLYDRHE